MLSDPGEAGCLVRNIQSTHANMLCMMISVHSNLEQGQFSSQKNAKEYKVCPERVSRVNPSPGRFLPAMRLFWVKCSQPLISTRLLLVQATLEVHFKLGALHHADHTKPYPWASICSEPLL